jgi:hypothetical protein
MGRSRGELSQKSFGSAFSYGQVLQAAPTDVQPVAFLQVTSRQVEFVTQDVPARHVASQRHDELQLTPLLQAPLAQVTEQGPAPHVTPAGQAFGPQLTAHDDEAPQSTTPLQELAPQLTEHGVAPHWTAVEQLFVSHVTEQLDATPQSTLPRHALPVHCTVHCPGPHVTPLGHAPEPAHVTSQLEASVQSTRPLQEAAPHETRHGTPAGQATVPPQLDEAEQSNTQTAPSHVPVLQAARHA